MKRDCRTIIGVMSLLRTRIRRTTRETIAANPVEKIRI